MSEQFAEWLKREMPAGTVISDPEWWAPRILKAALSAAPQPVGKPIAYVLMRDGEVDYDSDSGCISNTPGDTLDESYKWVPVYAAPQPVDEPVAWRFEEYVYASSVGHVWTEKVEMEKPKYGMNIRSLTPLFAYTKPADITELQQDYIDLHNKHEALKERFSRFQEMHVRGLDQLKEERDSFQRIGIKAQAEVERLKALSVENILIDVVPGDGSGHEVFAKSVEDVKKSISNLIAESETWELKHADAVAEVERLKAENEIVKGRLNTIMLQHAGVIGKLYCGSEYVSYRDIFKAIDEVRQEQQR